MFKNNENGLAKCPLMNISLKWWYSTNLMLSSLDRVV